MDVVGKPPSRRGDAGGRAERQRGDDSECCGATAPAARVSTPGQVLSAPCHSELGDGVGLTGELVRSGRRPDGDQDLGERTQSDGQRPGVGGLEQPLEQLVVETTLTVVAAGGSVAAAPRRPRTSRSCRDLIDQLGGVEALGQRPQRPMAHDAHGALGLADDRRGLADAHPDYHP